MKVLTSLKCETSANQRGLEPQQNNSSNRANLTNNKKLLFCHFVKNNENISIHEEFLLKPVDPPSNPTYRDKAFIINIFVLLKYFIFSNVC